MGPGIAQTFSQVGHEAILVDIDDRAISKGMQVIDNNLRFFVEAGILTASESEQTRSRIKTSTDLGGAVSTVDLAIEAVPENLELKKSIFSKMEASSSDDTILASNTSSLSLTQIASGTRKPSRVIGTHYLNPPHLVRIVEVVLGKETSPETADRVFGILKECGKKPVLVKDVPGFVHNRLICALMREAMYMASNNIASVEAIDTIVKEAFGPRFPLIGIFGLEDNVGLDVLRDVSNQVFPSLDDSDHASSWLTDKINKGNLGAKTGKGFYEWPEGSAMKTRQELTQRFVDILKSAKQNQ